MIVHSSEIPLSPSPQRFTITLAGTSYELTFMWRETTEGGWFLDIAEPGAAPIIQGIPLVIGVDLLKQYGYLGIAGSLIVMKDDEPTVDPTFDDLGVLSHVYFVTT
jgi:hypothetical protein